jgi:hypothetical protein
LRAFLKNPTETFRDSAVAAILDGAHPLKALRVEPDLLERASD